MSCINWPSNERLQHATQTYSTWFTRLGDISLQPLTVLRQLCDGVDHLLLFGLAYVLPLPVEHRPVLTGSLNAHPSSSPAVWVGRV